MNRYIIAIVIIVSLIASISCQEPYFDDNLDANKKIPCLEACILSNDNPKTLNLYYARPYNSNNTEEIGDATVLLLGDNGSTYNYHFNAEGYYILDDEAFIPAIGETWTLEIHMADGNMIKSVPQKFPDTLGISKGKFILRDERQVITKTAEGKTQLSKETGLGCYVILNSEVERKTYYRLRSDYMINSIVQRSSTQTYDSVIFENNHPDTLTVEVRVDTTIETYQVTLDANYPVVGKIEPGISYTEENLKHLVNFFDDNYRSIDGFVRWIIFLDVITINQPTFEYYQKVNKMLNEPFRIYDPIPEQIMGNLYNDTDSAQVVLGNFEVGSVNTRIYEVYLDPVWKVLVTHEITDTNFVRINQEYRTINRTKVIIPKNQ